MATNLVIIGRHSLTSKQEELLKKAFGEYNVIGRIATLDLSNETQVAMLRSADAVVIQTLPVDLIAQVLKVTDKPVYIFDIKALGVVTSKEAIEEAVRSGADIVNIDPRTGNARVAMTVSLSRIKKVEIIKEVVATVE